MIEKKDRKFFIFILLITLTYLGHLVLFLNNPTGAQRYLYFIGFDDLFADFFNCCIHVSDRNPYFTNYFFQSNYLPFVNMIFYPFSLLADYRHFSLADCWNSNIAMFSCFIFILFGILLLLHSILCLCRKYKTNKFIILAIIFSGVFLHTIERANILLFSTAFLFYFLAFYDSENNYYSYFAAICLALASVIKVYPVLYGLLYLNDYKKNFRKILLSFITAFLLAFLPFLFFKHGFENLPRLFEILSGTETSYTNYISRFDFKVCGYLFLRFFDLKDFAPSIIPVIKYFTYFISFLSLFFAFLINDYLKKMLLITMSVLYLPPFSWFYCSIYLIPLLIYYMRKNENDNIKKITHFLFFLFFYSLFMPFGLGSVKNVDLRLIIINCVSFVIWIYILIDSLIEIYKKFLSLKK